MAFFIYWIIRVSNFANTKALQNLHTWGASEAAPHTWRILDEIINSIFKCRIISTYVENTFTNSRSNLWSKDHLHIRGEYNLLPKIQIIQLGSSPHTWRILRTNLSKPQKSRIISTYVENTVLTLRKWVWQIGSSPHTWRIHYFDNGSQFAYRIISTYVENTYSDNL